MLKLRFNEILSQACFLCYFNAAAGKHFAISFLPPMKILYHEENPLYSDVRILFSDLNLTLKKS